MESNAQRQIILRACGRILEPIVRLLLKAGITWKDFADLAKAKFVEVATDEFGIKGRPTNVSRVAILTGLDRREVHRLRASKRSEGEDPPPGMSRATQVLAAWFNDPVFRSRDEKPRDLPFDAGTDSFSELVKRYAPGIPPVAMAKELKAAGAVADLPGGMLRVLKRQYVPTELDGEKIRLWGDGLHSLGVTLEHNLLRNGEEQPRFERRAISLNVDPAAVPAFQKMLEAEGQAFLVQTAEWLTRHGADSTSSGGIRLGVGLYHIEDRPRRRTGK